MYNNYNRIAEKKKTHDNNFSAYISHSKIKRKFLVYYHLLFSMRFNFFKNEIIFVWKNA